MVATAASFVLSQFQVRILALVCLVWITTPFGQHCHGGGVHAFPLITPMATRALTTTLSRMRSIHNDGVGRNKMEPKRHVSQSLTTTPTSSSSDNNLAPDETTTTTTLSSSMTTSSSYWTFRGHKIYTEVSNPALSSSSLSSSSSSSDSTKPAVLLVHGFACSSTYWRETKRALVENGYRNVHCMDLLGQGKSEKPGRADGIEYSIHLWAEQVDAYVKEKMLPMTTASTEPNSSNHGGIVFCGNSLGSLVVLSAVTGDFLQTHVASTNHWNHFCKGICMFNCGVGLNSRGIANEDQWTPFQRFLINSVYNVLDVLVFRNTALLTYVLDTVVTKELLRDTLKSLYKCQPDRVDEELVDSFYLPAKDVGSVEALSQIYTNDPGATPMDLHRKYENDATDTTDADANKKNILSKIPIHLIWGDDDAVTPLGGGVGQYYMTMASNLDNVSFQVVSGGHIPFDDNPMDSHKSMQQWLDQL
jgi:pimeloyl-ACP methyl ester carboxylesterase